MTNDRLSNYNKQAGKAANEQNRPDVDAWFKNPVPDLIWQERISVPFSYAASKNNIYAMRRSGQLMLRRESKELRKKICLAMKAKLYGRKIAHNKVWIEILVQKPNHKGDAVNVVDLVCDALKDAIPVDDRWFSIRILDWHIIKEDPKLYIAIGQETDEDAQVCSYCGLIKSLDHFHKDKRSPIGVGRECNLCRKQGRVLAKRVQD